MADLNLSAPLTSPETLSGLVSGASEVLREVPMLSFPPEVLAGPETLVSKSISQFIGDSFRDSLDSFKDVSKYPGIIMRGFELSGEALLGVQAGAVASVALGIEGSQQVLTTLSTAPLEIASRLPLVPEPVILELQKDAAWFSSLTPETQLALAGSATALGVALGTVRRVFPHDRFQQLAREFVDQLRNQLRNG